MSRRRYGTGGYTVAEPWCLIAPRLNGLFPGVILLHGAGGEEWLAEPAMFPGVASVIDALAKRFTIFVPDGRDGVSLNGSHTWGTDASTDTVDHAITYAQATPELQVASGKILLFGTSMGFVTACNYARRFPNKVAGVIGVSGATDVDYHYANGYAANIDGAYGGSWANNGKLPVSHSPRDFAAQLPSVPLMMWTAPNDTTVPPTGAGSHEAFMAAFPGTRKAALNTGVGGHNDLAWTGIDKAAVLDFADNADW